MKAKKTKKSEYSDTWYLEVRVESLPAIEAITNALLIAERMHRMIQNMGADHGHPLVKSDVKAFIDTLNRSKEQINRMIMSLECMP